MRESGGPHLFVNDWWIPSGLPAALVVCFELFPSMSSILNGVIPLALGAGGRTVGGAMGRSGGGARDGTVGETGGGAVGEIGSGFIGGSGSGDVG